MAWRTGSGTAGIFTPGGAWMVPCSRPTAKVRALILVPEGTGRLSWGCRFRCSSVINFGSLSKLYAWLNVNQWWQKILSWYATVHTYIYVWHSTVSFFQDPQILVYPCNWYRCRSPVALNSLGNHHTYPSFWSQLHCEKKVVSNTSFMANIMTAFSSPDVPALSIGTVLVQVTGLVPLLTTLDTLKLDNNSKNNDEHYVHMYVYILWSLLYV